MSEKVETWEELLEDPSDVEYVDVTIGKRTVTLASVNSEEMMEWFTRQADPELKKTNGLWLVAKCLVNSKNERIGNLDEIVRLREKQPASVKKLVEAAVELNHISVKREAEAKNDSQEGPAGSSPIASPETPAA